MRSSKPIILCIYGTGTYSLNLVPITRKNVYGERKIVPLDKDNNECKSAFVDEEGTGIYPAGSFSMCKILKDGTAYYSPKKKGESVLFEETEVYTGTSSSSENTLYPVSIDRARMLLNSIESVYTLEKGDKFELIKAMDGKVFTMGFRSGKNGSVKEAYVFENNGTVFLEVCKPAKKFLELAKKDQTYSVSDEPLIQELDDIDFSLF